MAMIVVGFGLITSFFTFVHLISVGDLLNAIPVFIALVVLVAFLIILQKVKDYFT